VLISSHLLSEVEQICDWLIVVEGGQLAYQGPTDQLMATRTYDVVMRPEHEDDVPLLADILAGFALPVTRRPADVLVSLGGQAEDADGTGHDRLLAQISRAAAARGVTLVEMWPQRLSLEDRYQGLVAQAQAQARSRSQADTGDTGDEGGTGGTGGAGGAAGSAGSLAGPAGGLVGAGLPRARRHSAAMSAGREREALR
jgi:hypothetical protein